MGPRLSAHAGTRNQFEPPSDLGARPVTRAGPLMGFGTPEDRVWYGQGPHHGGARLVIVLLYGSGRDGRAMLAMWKDFAKRQTLILAAPRGARLVACDG
ncbi:hypothetical protein ACN2XU_12555 [Primorskyibacter sp. 2E107]|uniref:hypothetical protein n=1 Tax=Primorskyibacter sp. 2E107 TaxID=3403458 RepID=UPI003AF88A4A